ncbi:ferric reductase NAD binding domain-containing protein [Lipomyces arxii]|uniref:ferric reductase NAD binding domain-containing protein n=1 Tax=Lipomyces arxii TaxID=56418 RepID=UPI0034CD2D0C
MKHRYLVLVASGLVTVLASLCEDACTKGLESYTFGKCKGNALCVDDENYSESYVLCLGHCLNTEQVKSWQAFVSKCHTKACSSSFGVAYSHALNASIEADTLTDKTATASVIQISHPMFTAQYEYQRAKANNIRNSQFFGGALVLYWVILITIASVSRLKTQILDKELRPQGRLMIAVKKHLLLPALFGYRHADAIRFHGIPIAVMPLRWQALSVLGFLTLNVVFLSAQFSMSSSAAPAMDVRTQTATFVAKRASIMAIMLTMPLLQFAGRNSILVTVTGWSNDTFKLFHRWIARTMVFNATVHSIAVTVYLTRLGGWEKYHATVPGLSFNIFGVVALVAGGLILFQALHYFQTYWYETFLTIHIIFVIVFVIAARIHIASYSVICYLYIGIALWAVDRLWRVARVLYGNFSGRAEIHANADATQIMVKPLVPFTYRPGQYAYLYVLRLNIWQSNPFSIAECRDNKFVFIAKRRKGVTARLHGLAIDSAFSARIWLEGPYGASFPLGRYQTVMLLAGGIGITPCISYALYLKQKRRDQRVTLIWTVRDKESINWIMTQLLTLSENPYLTVHVFVTAGHPDKLEDDKIEIDYLEDKFESVPDKRRTMFEMMPFETVSAADKRRTIFEMDLNDDSESFNAPVEDQESVYTSDDEQLGVPSNVQFHYYKPKIASVIRDMVNDDRGSLAIFSCGPVRMVDEARAAVVKNVDDNCGKRIDYFEDAFS